MARTKRDDTPTVVRASACCATHTTYNGGMTLNLTLSPDLEDRLRQAAGRRGVSLDEATIELLDKHLPHDNTVMPNGVRRHEAFLNGYAVEDEGIYDDLGR